MRLPRVGVLHGESGRGAMGKTRDWPTDLRKKINFRQSRRDDFLPAYIIECERRIRLLFDFFGVDPKLHGSWQYLIVRLCNHWDIPGFQSSNAQGRGAPRRWTDIKNCELFADVMALTPSMSEHAACVHICKNAAKYGERYSAVKPKTIHRQFLRAKNQIKTDQIFRLQYFSDGLGPTDFGPGFIKEAVKRYGLRGKSKP
jgi:hypothetical protein